MANIEKTIKINVEGNVEEKVENVVEATKSLKQQLREATLEVGKFEEGSEAFVKAAAYAGDLRDRVDGVNAQVKLLGGDSLERVASGFKGVGSAILDLDTGKLKAANASLGSIDFKSLMGNVKAFGKELFVLATNPLFLIPTVIGLIISNFDKLLKIFPGLGKIVDGVKAIFDKLVNTVLSIIKFAGDLYQRFKVVIDALSLGLIPLIGFISDALVDAGDTAEEQSKRMIAAQEKYGEELKKTTSELTKSRIENLVKIGKLSEEDGARQIAKENFITSYIKIQEDKRLKIKEDASKEGRVLIDKQAQLEMELLNVNYRNQLADIDKKEKEKVDAKIKKNEEANKKVQDDNAKETEKQKAALEKFNADVRSIEEANFNDFQKISAKEFDEKEKLRKEYEALSEIEGEKQKQTYLNAIREIELKAIDETAKLRTQKEKEIEEEQDKEKKARFEKRAKDAATANANIEKELNDNLDSNQLELDRLKANGKLTLEESIRLENEKFEILQQIAIQKGETGEREEFEHQQRLISIQEEANKKKIAAAESVANSILGFATTIRDINTSSQETDLEIQQQNLDDGYARRKKSIEDTVKDEKQKAKLIKELDTATFNSQKALELKRSELEKKKIKQDRNLALAQVAIGSAVIIANALSSTSKTDPITFAISLAANLAVAIGAIAKAKNALKLVDTATANYGAGGGPSAGDVGGDSDTTASGPIKPPTFNISGQQIGGASNFIQTGNNGNGQGVIPVVVSETDITKVVNKVKVIQGNSLFGSGG